MGWWWEILKELSLIKWEGKREGERSRSISAQPLSPFPQDTFSERKNNELNSSPSLKGWFSPWNGIKWNAFLTLPQDPRHPLKTLEKMGGSFSYFSGPDPTSRRSMVRNTIRNTKRRRKRRTSFLFIMLVLKERQILVIRKLQSHIYHFSCYPTSYKLPETWL